MAFSTKLSIWVVAMALCAAAIVTTNAEDIPSCASNLASCFPYLDTTSKPPATCCIPLKMVIANEFECLCSLFNNSTGYNGGNVTQAISLAERCGATFDLSACGTAQPPHSSTSPTPAPATAPTATRFPGTPPPVAGTGSNPSSAQKIAFASSAGFLGVVFFWVSSIILN